MEYTSIPGIKTKVSKICFGAGNVDFEHGRENIEMLDAFLAKGGNFIDTANIYGKWLESGSNESEIILGQWLDKKIVLERSIQRSDIVISTKGGHPNLETMDIPRIFKKDILKDLEESLMSMNTDYIDIYWLHRDAPQYPIEMVLEPLLDIRKEGKILFFGLSNWSSERIVEAEKFLDDKNCKNGLFGIQNRWGYAAMNIKGTEDPTLVSMTQDEYDWHFRTRIASMPYSGMAKGYFTKLQKSGKNKLDQKLLDYYDNDLNDERMKALSTISCEINRPVSQISLAFLLNQSFPVFPIVRFANEYQMADAFEATSIILSDRQMDLLRQGRSF